MEAIRGVNVEGVIHTLEARNLIRMRGRKDAPGKPILYGTTSEFLQHFGLKSLEELPRLKEFQEKDLDFVKADGEHQVVDTTTGQMVEQPAKEVTDVPNESGAPAGRVEQAIAENPEIAKEYEENADVAKSDAQ